MQQVIILGAGLSGLSTAYQLKKIGIQPLVLEARSRIGGRIFSLEGPIEMGATWFGPQHLNLIKLLKEVAIESFPQHVEGKVSFDPGEGQAMQFFDYPTNQAPSFRIEGGSAALINALADSVGRSSIVTGVTVDRIALEDDLLHVFSNDIQWSTSAVVNTIPPQLFEAGLSIQPANDSNQLHLMENTHTWMGESIKFGFSFKNPFWKEKGMSGMGFSQSGVIQEVHDHTNASNNFFALKGFLNPELASLDNLKRKRLVIETMVRLFGEEASYFISYEELLWSKETMTSKEVASDLAPHQNNGHPLLAKPLLNDRLIMAGSETSAEYAGYMEGAVCSGQRAAKEAVALLTVI
ncbi:MAG: monoamine oxidase [Candidatus Endobugula sp.]|jgi:monoamine oxidase